MEMRLERPDRLAALSALHPLVRMLLAGLAGLLAALAMEPWTVWPAAPAGAGLLLLLMAARPGAACAAGLTFAFAHFTLSLGWIAAAFVYQAAMPAWLGWAAVAGLSLFLALYTGLAAWLAAWPWRRRESAPLVPLTLAFAGLFLCGELLRGLLFTGFPWNPLGAALLPLEGVSRMAAAIGANGLSALVVLMGGLLAGLLLARGWRGRAVVSLALLGFIGVGMLLAPAPGPEPEADAARVLLVQTGTGIADKHGDGGARRSVEDALTETRAALTRAVRPDVIIWPEATVEYPLEELPELRRALVADLTEGMILLTGGVAIERDESGRALAARNSLFALDSAGRILARYDKAHLVPGGEYLPLRGIAEPLGLARLVPGSLDFWPGPGPLTWALPGLPLLAPNICYEIIFPGVIVDRSVRPAAIVTVSNDAWFGPTGPPQHHAQARLRAIEEGLPVLRVTPTGVTGLIDARGRMRVTLPRGQPASAQVLVPPALAPTPFGRLGLLMPLLLAGVLLAAAGLLWRNRKKT
jgi:apolipoprotein N-acyltransferase